MESNLRSITEWELKHRDSPLEPNVANDLIKMTTKSTLFMLDLMRCNAMFIDAGEIMEDMSELWGDAVQNTQAYDQALFKDIYNRIHALQVLLYTLDERLREEVKHYWRTILNDQTCSNYFFKREIYVDDPSFEEGMAQVFYEMDNMGFPAGPSQTTFVRFLKILTQHMHRIERLKK